MLAPSPYKNSSSRIRGGHAIAFIAAVLLLASACGVDTDARITAANQADLTNQSNATEAVSDPVVAAPVETTVQEQATTAGAATPAWWFGCDSDNFVFEGVGPEAVFAALGEPAADRVSLSDNPLGVGLITDCRASNDTTRVSIIAVPPFGGLLETVDNILAIEPGAEERTIAGNRAGIYTDTGGFSPQGIAHFNLDGFSIIVTAEDRDSRQLSVDQLKQMAASAAEAFLTQL